MRLAGIASIAQAQAFVPTFITQLNAKFAVPPRDARDAHRAWTGGVEGLDEALARREERTLSEALTFSTGGTVYCVRTNGPGTALRGAKVMLSHFLDGSMRARYKDRVLALTRVRSLPIPSPAEDEKTIDARIDAIVLARNGAPAASLPGCG